MKRGLRRSLQVVAALAAFVVLLFGSIAYSAFGGNTAIVDGAEPASGVRIVKDGIVSLGVVDVGGNQLLLIDAGNDPTGKALLAELARRQLGTDAVSAIFLTHGHADHLAGAHLFPKAALYALEPDVEMAEGHAGSHGPITHLMPVKPTNLHITRALHDNETVVVGSRSVRVFAVPGHTAGSAAYLVGGVLFLGDSAGMKESGKLAGAPWALSDDSAQNRASLKALADRLRSEQIGIVAIAPAHTGTSTFDPLGQFAP